MTLGAQCPSAGRPRCYLCSVQDHVLAQYTAAIPPEEKRKRLQTDKCCCRCGEFNHLARQCRTAKRLVCGHCSRRHLTTLCDIQRPAGRFDPGSRRPDHSRSDKATLETANAVTSASTSAARYTPVLLQEAVHGASAQAASCCSFGFWILAGRRPSYDAMCPEHSLVPSPASSV